MKTSRRQQRRLVGFTLVEVLVCVTIIGVLAVLAFPALRAARGKANDTACAANLRTLHRGCIAYSNDHNARLPFRYDASQGATYGGYGSPLWFIAVAPYLGIPVQSNAVVLPPAQLGPFKCPSDEVPFNSSCSYAFPLRLATFEERGVQNTQGKFTSVLSRFERPEETVMLIDSNFGNVFNIGGVPGGVAWNDPEEALRDVPKRHNGFFTAVFVDGHIEKIPGDIGTDPVSRPYLWGGFPIQN